MKPTTKTTLVNLVKPVNVKVNPEFKEAALETTATVIASCIRGKEATVSYGQLVARKLRAAKQALKSTH